MINDNENRTEKEKQITYRSIHGHEYTKCKTRLNIIIVICIKQHLTNI